MAQPENIEIPAKKDPAPGIQSIPNKGGPPTPSCPTIPVGNPAAPPKANPNRKK